MATIGYARVSTTDQNTAMQIADLDMAGCERVFTDHGVSGTKESRPQLDAMLDHLRKGDQVVVWKLDRLGRNTRHLLDLLDGFKQRGIKFRSLRDGISTDPDSDLGAAMATAMITIMSAFAQLERDQLAERTRAGMAAAKAAGRKAGRPEMAADSQPVRKAQEARAKGLGIADIQKLLGGVSRATVYRYLSMAQESA